MNGKKRWLAISVILILSLLFTSCRAAPAPAPKPTTQAPAPAPTAAPKPSPAPAPAPTAAPKPAPAPAPAVRKPEGTLRIAADSLGTEKWLPHQGSGIQQTLISAVFDTLVGSEIPSGQPTEPQLAEKWEISKDGLSWTFYLRKGIQFHDNWGELTAEDVKFSMELVMLKDSVSSVKGPFVQYVKSIEVVNPYQLVVHTKSPFVTLPSYVTSAPIYLGITSKKYVDSVGEKVAQAHPIGTGPYKFKEQKAGTSITLEALDTHWRKTGDFKTIVQVVVPEQSTRLAMLKTGELDIAQIDATYKKEAKSMGVQFVSQPQARELFVALGGLVLPSRPTYDPNLPWVGPDPEKARKVRQALNLAVNKKEIIDALLQGEGEELPLPGFFAGLPWSDPAWKPYPYDPAKAKQLLAEAGYQDGFEITMRPTPFPGVAVTVDVAEAVAMYWEKIGLKVKREPIEYNVDRAELVARKVPPGKAWARALTPKDEPVLNSAVRTTDSIMYHAESTYVDDMLKKAGGETDVKKRIQTYLELGKFFYEGYYNVPIASMNSLFGVSNKVGKLGQVNRLGYLVHMEYITRR